MSKQITDAELLDFEKRARSAANASWPEDAESMADECLRLIDELRPLRSIADAAAQLRRVRRHFRIIDDLPYGYTRRQDAALERAKLALRSLDAALLVRKRAQK